MKYVMQLLKGCIYCKAVELAFKFAFTHVGSYVKQEILRVGLGSMRDEGVRHTKCKLIALPACNKGQNVAMPASSSEQLSK